MSDLTKDAVQGLLGYDTETGLFRWLVSHKRIAAGSIAGTIKHGYRVIRINGKGYMAHRLAFLLMTGDWPVADVDHVDGVGTNNAWSNLRNATRAQNIANSRLWKRSATGLKGVTFDVARDKFVAQIKKDGKSIFLGRFSCANEAHAAYVASAQQIFGEFARSA